MRAARGGNAPAVPFEPREIQEFGRQWVGKEEEEESRKKPHPAAYNTHTSHTKKRATASQGA